MSTSERQPSETITSSFPNEANVYKTPAKIKMLCPVLQVSIWHYVFQCFMRPQGDGKAMANARDEHLTPGTLPTQQEPFARRFREQKRYIQSQAGVGKYSEACF